MPVTVAATCCATLVDEWVRAGLTDAVVAPGSRSTPLALALAGEPRVRVHVFHDERSAAFAALGIGLASGRPAVLVCTSGTAAAEFHAAVVEAHQADVPMIVCTADRPPELRDVAAPQTIDQARLFGPAVRWYVDPGVPDEATASTWRPLAARAVAEATGLRPGPVHLNLPFRDPLVGEPGPLPAARPGPWQRRLVGAPKLDPATLDALAGRLDRVRGVIIAGAGAGDPAAVHDLARRTGWPVLADWRSGCRVPGPTTVAAADALVRDPAFAREHAPEVVVQLGMPWASKALSQWLAATDPYRVVVTPTGQWVDPDHAVAELVLAEPGAWCAALAPRLHGATGTPWLARWQRAEQAAQAAIDAALGDPGEVSEPGTARRLVRSLPDGTTLVVSSSMPVRDVEWYGPAQTGLRVVANRGANGIDGVVSTAVGVALTGVPTALLIGDVAFLHDANGLIGVRDRPGVDLLVVVVDNGGGGIFEFLPQATALTRDRFEQLFGTPHGVDVAAVAAAHGLPVLGVDAALGAAGVRVAVVRTDRRANVAVHDRIHRAVAAALGTPG